MKTQRMLKLINEICKEKKSSATAKLKKFQITLDHKQKKIKQKTKKKLCNILEDL